MIDYPWYSWPQFTSTETKVPESDFNERMGDVAEYLYEYWLDEDDNYDDAKAKAKKAIHFGRIFAEEWRETLTPAPEGG